MSDVKQIGITESQLRDFFAILDRWDSQKPENGVIHDGRAAVRIPFKLQKHAILSEVEKGTKKQFGERYQVRLRNISRGGMAIIHGVMMPVGQLVEVKIPENGIKTYGTITRRRTLIEPISEFGIQFEEEVDITTLEQTVQAAAS